MMKKVLYCTALYSKQAYCQEERLEAFNKLYMKALEDDIEIHAMTLVNNSPKKFYKDLLRLYMKEARFPYTIADYGHINYETDYERKDYDWAIVDSDGKAVKNTDQDIEVFSVVHKDIYRLLAHLFNLGIDHAVEKGFDFFGILSGDQIPPPEHASTLVKFLEEHQDAGIAATLTYFDFSKKEIVHKGKTRTYMIPLVIIRERPGETKAETDARRAWIFAHLLPHPENNMTGMAYCEVDAVGTGGSLIPRKVFTKLKFDERPFQESGCGEDVSFCYEVKDKLGLKCYSVPTLVVPNRYESGEFY
jgi:hypothetical protein